MSTSLDMQVSDEIASTDLRVISPDESNESVEKVSKTYPKKIDFLDKALLILISIISATAITAAVIYDSKTKNNTQTTKIASPLEDKLAKYQVLGKAEVWYKDVERLPGDKYIVHSNNGTILYEFDIKNKRLLIYPLIGK